MKNTMYNHIAYVLDSSGSMDHLWRDVLEMADKQIRNLEGITEQENRVSVYKFSDTVQNICFERSPSAVNPLRDERIIGRQTALIDAIAKAIEDFSTINTGIGDHTFLIYVLTDGQENRSHNVKSGLVKTINSLGDRWTIAAFVPDRYAIGYMTNLGLSAGNVMVWEQSRRGVEEVSRVVHESTQSYSSLRSMGHTTSRNLLEVGANIDPQAVKQNLSVLQPRQYVPLYTGNVAPKTQIRDFVEDKLGRTYLPGCAFYQLVKPETVQFHKEVLVRDRSNGLVYEGKSARQLIGLPNHDVKVTPSAHANYDIFVGSTSYNRHVSPNSNLIVRL